MGRVGGLMGIQQDMTRRLSELPLPKPFSVCELGAQGLCVVGQRNTDPRGWWASIGCGRYESIDGNGDSTLTADLNRSLRDHVSFMEAFDLVTDFGTGEHIFDQAQVWRTIHDLVKPGGYIAFDRPTTDYYKHCFYLINECVVRDVAAANHYTIEWFERKPMPRGAMIRGILRVPTVKRAFCIPQQGRYRPDLVVGA